MRKLVLILVASIAIITFIRALDYSTLDYSNEEYANGVYLDEISSIEFQAGETDTGN